MTAHPGVTRAIVLLSAAGALAASVGVVGAPWRAVLIFWFVAVIPGVAVQPWLGVADPLARATLAVAISVALTAIASEALAIAGIWSPTALVLFLALVSVASSLPRRAVA